VRGSYRYAVFEASPEAGSEPLLRYELHPFEGGRTREIYGHGSFEHLHVGASRQHVPTGKVSLEDFLGFVLTEGTDLSEGDASRLVGLLKDAEKNANEWREL
jgi:hypothetical protein